MKKNNVFFGILIILIGLSFLFNFSFFRFLFAAFIIWLGIRLLTGEEQKFDYGFKGKVHEDFLKRILIFSGINEKVVSNDFQGTDLVAIFGGGEVDLSEVKLSKGKAELNLVAIFGGLKIKVPKNCNIRSEGIGILGGFNNKASGSSKNTASVLIRGVAIFGGVEIVN